VTQSAQPFTALPRQPVKRRKVWPWIVGPVVAIIVIAAAVNGGDKDAPSGGDKAATGAPAGNEAGAAQPAAPAEAAPRVRTVVYRVSGTGTASITYTTDGMTTMNQETAVTLPWEKTITLPAGEELQLVSILAQGDGSGSVDVAILVDGQLIKEAHADGYGVASANENIGTLG
jgi:hypothetical protein